MLLQRKLRWRKGKARWWKRKQNSEEENKTVTKKTRFMADVRKESKMSEKKTLLSLGANIAEYRKRIELVSYNVAS